MFRFFRQLRHRLLPDNKASKYLLYAIGEIVLVVLGILIALQINTWNEEYKNRQKGKEYMTRLLEELETDQKNMEFNLEFYQDVARYGQNALDYADKGLQEGQTHWEALLSFFQAGQIWPLQQGSATYEELKSTGDFALVDNPEIRKDLVFYYGQGLLSYSQTVGIIPPYRKMVRGKIPLGIQNYMWENCHVTQGVIQYMKACPSPIPEEEAKIILSKLAADQVLLEELRFFMSNIRAGMTPLSLQSELCGKILADIRLHLDSPPE